MRVRDEVRMEERAGEEHLPHPQPLLHLCCMLVLNLLSIPTVRLVILRAGGGVADQAGGLSTGGGLEGEHGGQTGTRV